MIAPIVGLLVFALAPGQSLADAAKRAEEQRKEAEGKPKISVTTRFDNFVESPLDLAVLTRYSNARSSMARLWHKDPPLWERVRGGGLAVERLRDFAEVLAIEPPVVELLTFFGYTPDEFVAMEMTLRRVRRRAYSGFAEGRYGKVEEANTKFYAAHATLIDLTIASWHKQEAGREVFPEWVPD